MNPSKNMKSTLMILALSVAGLALRAAEVPAVSANATNRLLITGMHCQGCANGLASELRRTPGVAGVTVTLTNRLAVVGHDTNRVSVRRLIAVIQEAGYAAELPRP